MTTAYTSEEVNAATLEYFGGDELATSTVVGKYLLRDLDGIFVEKEPTDIHKRMAAEFARIETKWACDRSLSESGIFKYMDRFKYIIPQGSPQFGIGNDYSYISLSNCVVVDSPEDDISSIINTGKDLANLFKRRCVSADSLLMTQEWGPIPMSDVKVGDMVLSYDISARRTVYRKVLDKFASKVSADDRIVITYSDGTQLRTSKKHPVLTFNGEYTYRDAGTLSVGDVGIRPEYPAASFPYPIPEIFRIPTRPLKQTCFLSSSEADEMGGDSANPSRKSMVCRAGKEGQISIETLRELRKYNIITEEKLREIVQRVNVVSIEPDTETQAYFDIEVEGTNNFYAGNGGLVNIHNCGVGTDLSNLRPDGFHVSNSAGTTTGAWSFADFYSYVCRMIGQNGRRGALMLTMDVRHPDILKFITMKHDLTKVTGANVSVKVRDDFMAAVVADEEYTLQFPVESETPEYTEVVRARDIWETLVKSATETAEPGILMWDNILKMLPAESYAHKGFKTISTNPCYSGDTKVLLANGSSVSIADLAEKGDDISVYSMSVYGGELCKSMGRRPRKTSERQTLYRISFMGGGHLDVTSSHRFWTKWGDYVTAGEMEAGTLLPGVTLSQLQWYTNTPQTVDPFITPHSRTCEWCGQTYLVSDETREVAFCSHKCATESQADKENCAPTEMARSPLPNLRVASIEKLPGLHDVYNLTVDWTHTVALDVGNNQAVFAGNCGEIPLSGGDSCRLIAINLTSFVVNPYTDEAYFDFDLFQEVVRAATRLSDDLVELEIEKLQGILSKVDTEDERVLWNKLLTAAVNGRRTGLGTLALGDTLARLQLVYGSPESVEQVEQIFEAFKVTAYDESVELAKERGPFPVWDWDTEKDNAFLLGLPQWLQAKMQRHGRRNISLLTQAPTGSTSIEAQTSSGPEPIFRLGYTRRKKINHNDTTTVADFVDELGDRWQSFEVVHHAVQDYWDIHGKCALEDLPDYFITADQIDWRGRVAVQAAMQRHIDHSISSTLGLPKGTSPEVVGGIYIEAWRQGLKGVTVYVDGSRSGVLVENTDTQPTDPSTEIMYHSAPKRPLELPCEIHHRVVRGEKWTILVGLLEGKPYEVFAGPSSQVDIPDRFTEGRLIKNPRKTVKSRYDLEYGTNGGTVLRKNIVKWFDNEDHGTLSRFVSMSLRHGVPVQYIVEQLLKDENQDMWSFNRVISRVLKTHIKDGEMRDKECPECGAHGLVYQEGCLACTSCGYSKCG